MRRAAAAGLLAAIAAGGCGGNPRPREVRPGLASPQPCHVDVFFATRMVTGREATRGEIGAVRTRLAASSRIKTFAFVSKKLAFRRMAKEYPGFTKGVPGNPLPASYEIVPRSADDARALKAELRSAKGVEHVSSARSC
jgi:cell division protein FtsX